LTHTLHLDKQHARALDQAHNITAVKKGVEPFAPASERTKVKTIKIAMIT